MVFSLLLNDLYIYDIFLLELLNQYSLQVRDSEERFYAMVAKAVVKIFNKKFRRYLTYIVLWLNNANQWLTISSTILSPELQTCYNLQEYLYAHKCINLIGLDFSWLECMTLS